MTNEHNARAHVHPKPTWAICCPSRGLLSCRLSSCWVSSQRPFRRSNVTPSLVLVWPRRTTPAATPHSCAPVPLAVCADGVKGKHGMETHILAALAAAPPVHPRDLRLPGITRSSHPLGWPGITVCHSQAPSLALDAPPLTTHVVSLALNALPRLFQQRDGRSVDRAREQWEVKILPAGHPSVWRADGPVENLYIALEPALLQHVALEVCDMDPARVELRHVFGGRDAVIKHLGCLLWSELATTGLGGAVYAASLAQVLALHLLRTACARTPILRHYAGGLPQYKLHRVLAYIHDHLAGPLPLVALAGVEIGRAHV